jgi:hypothetical protein
MVIVLAVLNAAIRNCADLKDLRAAQSPIKPTPVLAAA